MLNLYSGITPNNTSTHYYFTSFNAYLTYLSSYLTREVVQTNYTITRDFIRVKLDDDITIANYNQVTYIVNTTDSVCYLVKSATIVSGYVYYVVTIDNWGTYISKASLEKINVKRTNRKISENGIYDAIINTRDFELVKLSSYSGTDMRLIMLIEGEELETQHKVQRLLLSPITQFTVQEIDKMSTVTKIKSGGIEIYNKVIVKRAWYVPSDIIPEDMFISQLTLHDTQDNLLYTTSFLATRDNIISTKTITYNTDLNKRYLIGSMGGTINEIKRTKNTQEIKYYYIFDNEIKLYVDNGNNQQNITKSIELPLFSRDNIQATTEISTTLRYIMGVTQLGVGIIGGSPLSFVKGIGTIGRGIENQFNIENEKNNPVNTSMLSDGNAIATYGTKVLQGENLSPYYLFVSTSLIDEEKKARITGATFNEYITDLPTLFNYSLLGTGTEDETYLQADIEVTNIPTDAINDITRKFNDGIHLIYVL